MSQTQRAIIHVDMDAFYASVEQLDDPDLKGKAVIVGGLGNRGVVSAASYEARRFGVHSAQPMVIARRRCPHGIYLTPRMAKYKEASVQIFEIFRGFTPQVEGLSLDEAFLDVTASRKLHGDIETIGRAIKRQILDKTGLVASVGMATNKFLAKLASDHNKPDGFCRVYPDRVQSFLDPLPVKRIWGIGRKAAQRLNKAGILTVGELRRQSQSSLTRLMGNQADHYLALCEGRDQREVVVARGEKSVSHERTFGDDVREEWELERWLLQLSELVGQRLRRQQLAGRTITVKLRTPGFETFTRSRTLAVPTNSDRVIYDEARSLFVKWWEHKRRCPVRLLGVGVSKFEAPPQTDLFGASEQASHSRVDEVLDEIQDKFGRGSLKRAKGLDQ